MVSLILIPEIPKIQMNTQGLATPDVADLVIAQGSLLSLSLSLPRSLSLSLTLSRSLILPLCFIRRGRGRRRGWEEDKHHRKGILVRVGAVGRGRKGRRRKGRGHHNIAKRKKAMNGCWGGAVHIYIYIYISGRHSEGSQDTDQGTRTVKR